jgi:hypothetical protein
MRRLFPACFSLALAVAPLAAQTGRVTPDMPIGLVMPYIQVWEG